MIDNRLNLQHEFDPVIIVHVATVYSRGNLDDFYTEVSSGTVASF